ncbi:hypothetical protein [Lysinibacillus sp. NPDC056185]|uniref:hypothetical protein n=1 Tax=Lysinibacillus sp. NPDC056185 TaxID=3345739 RepID=UPI0039F086B7
MIKITKKNKLEVGQVFAVKIAHIDKWTIAQICCLPETDGYYAIGIGLFDVIEASLQSVQFNLDTYNLEKPIIVGTFDVNPKKDWTLIGSKHVCYKNFDLEKSITGTWGWINNTESGFWGILEIYFGVYPWDLFVGKSSIENKIIGERPSNIRLLKGFDLTEITNLGLLGTIKHANRLDELNEK